VIVVDASAVIAFFLREEGWENLKPYMRVVLGKPRSQRVL
jgi:PIN domain nuclease of toxin-antitoxin system